MRKSREITLTVLSGLMLTGCCITSRGCGKRGSSTSSAQQYEPPDRTWYDANGNVIPEKWKTDAQGNRVLDVEGRPIPEPGVPYDRHHRPWAYTNHVWAPLLVPIAYSSLSRSSSWLTGSSGYRSSGTTTTYRSGTGSGSSSVGSSSPPSGSSISRGGFGSTGSSSSSSSSS